MAVAGRKLSIDEMRGIQLSLMDTLDGFCTQRGIRYSLSGGSLLGAVRHKGFIPWDDDVDVLMPRPDYERLLDEFPPEGIGRFSLRNLRNDPDWHLRFTRLVDNGTKVLIRHNGLCNCGVFIDIFAVDGQPSDEEALDDYVRRFHHLDRQLHKRAPIHRYTTRPGVKLKVALRRHFYPRVEVTAEALENLYREYPYESSEFAGAIMGGSGKGTHVPKETFEHYIRLPFEGRMYSCIEDYDTYLTRMYGDYMTPPPPSQRKLPHLTDCYEIQP